MMEYDVHPGLNVLSRLRDALRASRPTRDFPHNKVIAMAYLLRRLGVL